MELLLGAVITVIAALVARKELQQPRPQLQPVRVVARQSRHR